MSEHEPLVAAATPAAPYKPPSLFCIRFSIIILLALTSGASIYLYRNLTALQAVVDSDHAIIEQLVLEVAEHHSVIARFNNSVTNSDVVNELKTLQASLSQTEARMNDQLAATEASIANLLNDTVIRLDQTVQVAENEIYHEVDIVKQNVDKYVRTTQDQFSMENSFMIWQLAGTFTILACLISMWHMTAHLRSFRRPHVQRKILAILWMSPIYGITSWLSLVFPKFEGYLSILKDFYEAYVIYQFLSFLISVIGSGERALVVETLSKNTEHLDPPMRMFGWCRKKLTFDTPYQMADAVLLQCQVFAMQFVLFKPLTSISLFVCNSLGYYGNFGATSASDYRSPQFWINIVQNVSIFLAFTGLLKFYHAVEHELSWCRPFSKFLCIKGIVFMTFWQGMVIAFLARTTSMAGSPTDSDHDPELWGTQAQNFMICLEMLLFSVAHFYCFPTEEWMPNHDRNKKAVGDKMAFGDFVKDLKLIMRQGKDKKTAKDIKKTSSSAKVAEASDDISETEDKIQDEECGDLTVTKLNSESPDISYDNSSTENDAGENVVVGSDEAIDESNDESFDVEKLTSSIQESLVSTDSEVREAANRMMSKSRMDAINEIRDNESHDVEENLDEGEDEKEWPRVVLSDVVNESDVPNESSRLLGGSSKGNKNL